MTTREITEAILGLLALPGADYRSDRAREEVFDAIREWYCLHCGGPSGCRCWDDS